MFFTWEHYGPDPEDMECPVVEGGQEPVCPLPVQVYAQRCQPGQKIPVGILILNQQQMKALAMMFDRNNDDEEAPGQGFIGLCRWAHDRMCEITARVTKHRQLQGARKDELPITDDEKWWGLMLDTLALWIKTERQAWEELKKAGL